MTFLAIRELQKIYGPHKAVDRLTLSVDKGEFVSLLGPSGSGKTTTLQMIAGLVEPTRGSIIMGDRDLAGIPINRRQIGIVFQSYALFPHMTVEDNVGFGLEMRKWPDDRRKAKVAEALELVHLAGLEHRYPRQLSGGQQQRVALARALVIEPELLLLDEPMSNLDAKLREDMQIELRMLQRDLKITTILVTHDQNEAMALSDRVAVMNKGSIVQIDSPNRAYEKPVDVFSSTFLGKSNLFRARMVSRSGMISRVDANGLQLDLPTDNIDAAVGDTLVCTLRPERICVVSAGSGNLQGTVKAAIFLGSYWLLRIDTALGDIVVFSQNSGVEEPPEGTSVGLQWSPASLRGLPAEAVT